MKHRVVLFALALLLTAVAFVSAHSGGLDAYGGHNDRRAGTYHFHRGPLAGQSFASKADALRALNAKQESSPRQAAPQTDRQERTVYITRTGKKYHGPRCSYLSRSRIPISLKDAQRRGYTACSRCGGK